MLNLFDKNKKNNTSNNSSVTCPKCGGTITEQGDYWICSNAKSNTCNFKIKNILDGIKIDFDSLCSLLNAKGSEKTFNSLRYLHNKNKDLFYHLGTNNPRPLNPTCPICSRSSLYLLDNEIKCGNKNCNSSISRTYKGVTFSDEETRHLSGKNISREYTFNDGTKGRVLIHLESGVPLRYVFFKDVRELNDFYLTYYGPSLDAETNEKFRYPRLKYILNNKKGVNKI